MFLRGGLISGMIILLSLIKLSATPLAPTLGKILKLSTGNQIKVLSVSKIENSQGNLALLVRYESTLSFDQRDLLDREVGEVWKQVRPVLEARGITEAILCPNEVPKGVFITASRSLNFAYEQDSNGKWIRYAGSEFATNN